MSRKHQRTIHRLANGGGLLGQVKVSGPNLAAQDVGSYAPGQARNQYLVNFNYDLPKWRRMSIDLGVYHFGIVPAAVNDAYYDSVVTALNLGVRYKFTLLGAPATLRVQSGNVTNLYFWNIAFSPGFLEFPPRTVLAYQTVDLSRVP
jgi:hypothetical protein